MAIFWQLRCMFCGIWLTDKNGDLYISEKGTYAQCKNAVMCREEYEKDEHGKARDK